MERETTKKGKAALVGVFVKKDKLIPLIQRLMNQFKIDLQYIYIYEIENNNDEYLMSIKTLDKDSLMKALHYTTVLHVKNGSLFSINALNLLIKSKNDNNEIECKDYKIDWDEYKDKLIVITRGELSVNSLKKVENIDEKLKA